eukprot:383994_1
MILLYFWLAQMILEQIKKAKTIKTALFEIYSTITKTYGAKCIAVTVPPYQRIKVYPRNEQIQNEVNEYIREKSNKEASIYLCDLNAYIHSLDKAKKESQFYDDFLHFT